MDKALIELMEKLRREIISAARKFERTKLQEGEIDFILDISDIKETHPVLFCDIAFSLEELEPLIRERISHRLRDLGYELAAKEIYNTTYATSSL